MNFEEQWKKMKGEDEDLSSMIKGGLPGLSSKDPIEKIKQNLLFNSIWGLSISAGYILVLVKFPLWPLFICLGFIVLATGWVCWKALLLRQKMGMGGEPVPLLEEMERHYEGARKWMKIQGQVCLLIYPVSIAGGFMLGGSVGSGGSIELFMQRPGMIVTLVVLMVVLVPLCWWGGRRMSRAVVGKYADQLKDNIAVLKAEE